MRWMTSGLKCFHEFLQLRFFLQLSVIRNKMRMVLCGSRDLRGMALGTSEEEDGLEPNVEVNGNWERRRSGVIKKR